MSASSKISAGEAFVTVSINNSALLQGLQTVSSKISEAAKNITSAEPSLSPKVELHGFDAFKAALDATRREISKTAEAGKKISDRLVITTGDIYGFFRSSCEKLGSLLGGVGDQFDKMSQRTGVSTSTLSEYAHAATMCGADISNVEGALKSMASAIFNAQSGSEKAKKVFEQLGVDYNVLSGQNPAKQFDELAIAIANISDPTERAAAAMKVFGSDGQKLLPLFSTGPSGLRELRKEAQELGVSIDEESASMGAAYVDATTRLKESLRGLGLTISRIVTPAITVAVNGISRINTIIIRFSKDNPLLTNTLVQLAGALSGLTSATFIASRAWTAYLNVVKISKDVFQTVSATVKSLNAVMLANPWLAVAAAIAAATAALVAWNYASKKKEYQSDAKDAYFEGSVARERDATSFDRLQTLQEITKQHRLSNDEVAEAARLAAELKSKYGDIGIEVDAVAGKINIATDAQRKLNDQMVAAKKRELQAAIDEAQLNESSGAIDRKMAHEEVGFFEQLLGKKRGESWGRYFTHFEAFSNDDDARLAILEGDEKFEAKLKAAKEKNQAQIATMQAELDALNASTVAAATSTKGGDLDEATLQSGVNIVAEFIDEASEEEKSALDRRIEAIQKKRNKLIDELRKLADPNGEIDWNDAAQVDKLYAESPTAAALQQQALQVDAAANAQIKREQQKDAQKQLEEQQRKIDEAQRKIDEFEKRRADEGKSDLQRKCDAIDEETQAYLDQLAVLKEIAKERGDQATENAIAVKEEHANVNAAERKNELLHDAQEKAFEKFATPAEKFANASQELQKSIFELQQAQESGDEFAIADALGRLGDAYDKYESLEDAVKGIGDNIGKSVGGTFNAWQAATQSTVNWDKQLYTETKTQTSYLREIAQKAGRGVVFG